MIDAERAVVDTAGDGVAAAVRSGLARHAKSLPPWLFYDQAGSALFEAITALPEYYLTRSELEILEANAVEIIDAAGPPLSLIELGAGTAAKTRVLIDATLEQQSRLVYSPIDVSASALAIASARLARPGLFVLPRIGRYEEFFPDMSLLPGRKLVLFIGSSIGNLEPVEALSFLTLLRRALRPGDSFLLGADLRKDPAVLVRAYDDAQGVTAAFNRNVLVRLNRDLEADFDPDAFRHVAVWNADASRIEMHLESRRAQTVDFRRLGLVVDFAAGERIHTENSYKLSAFEHRRLLADAGFHHERLWSDARGAFAVHLARVP